ncbi:MAG: cytochrome c oxidase assembly protein [Chloroflexi bacterium]|nr:cytochrome c oxidase assembly protein [Chloroflexota bacterium]
MNPLLQILFTWEFRPEVLILPLIFAALYLRGWLRVREMSMNQGATRWKTTVLPDGRIVRGARRDFLSGWRPVAYYSGLLLLLFALLSGLDAFSSMLFVVHMIQHLLLMMAVPVLIWLGEPYPFIVWGLPKRWRMGVSRLMASPSSFRRLLVRITAPGLVLFYLVAALWVWHDGEVYSLALRYAWVHDLEHLSFFTTGLLFWWHVTAAAPRLHRRMSYLKRAVYAIAPAPFNMVLGVAITFSEEPWYDYYVGVPRVWGVSVHDDQVYGGVLMWLVGTMMFLMAVFVLIAQYLRLEEQKAPLHHARWAKKERLIAPGLEKRVDSSLRSPKS